MSDELLEAARRSADHAEVYRVQSESQPVGFEANRLKDISRRDTAGVALRVIKDGRLGFSATTDPSAEAELPARVAELAAFGAEAAFTFPAQETYPDVPVLDSGLEKVSFDQMAQTGQSLIDRIRADWPQLVCEANLGKSIGSLRICNSAGVDAGYRQSSYYVGIGGTLIRGTDMLFVWEGYSSCRYFSEDDRMVASVLRQLELARDTAAAPRGRLPVIFSPRGFVAALLRPLLSGFDGKNVINGASPVADRLGERLLDERISICDDPTIPYAAGSRPLDDEGVPARRVPLVNEGIVGEFLLDLQTAGRAGRRTTGSAQRGLTSMPAPGVSVIDIAPGDTPYDDLFAGIKEGLVVEQLLGAGQGNELGGDFKANVLLGYRIENGRIVGRVKDTMISGNVYRALSQVEAISSEPEWVYGSVRTPAFRCDDIEVAAKG